MRFEDIYKSNNVAGYITEAASNKEPFLGEAFFPNDKIIGLSAEWLRQNLDVNIMLNASNLDAQPKIRTREGFKVENTELAFFRESMHVRERDMLMLSIAENQNNPYVRQAMANAYDDVSKLVDAADIAVEAMRMQLLATDAGTPKISLGMVDNTIYTYNYDPNGTWKTGHYTSLTGTSAWDKTDTATPLDDVNDAKRKLRKLGFAPTYALMNSNTFAYLLKSAQIKAALVNVMGTAVTYVNEAIVKDSFRQNTGLTILLYDKVYKDYTGTEKYFFPDDTVTILGSSRVGRTLFGTTPEERTLIGNPTVDITILERGVAIAVKTEAGPPVKILTTVSQMAVPSYEGMDGVYVLNVNGD